MVDCIREGSDGFKLLDNKYGTVEWKCPVEVNVSKSTIKTLDSEEVEYRGYNIYSEAFDMVKVKSERFNNPIKNKNEGLISIGLGPLSIPFEIMCYLKENGFPFNDRGKINHHMYIYGDLRYDQRIINAIKEIGDHDGEAYVFEFPSDVPFEIYQNEGDGCETIEKTRVIYL